MTRDAGLTLIELTAAMAVFALVAVMGMQALNASLRMSSGLNARDAATWQVAEALALIRHDLGARDPSRFVAPDGRAEPALLFDQGSNRLAMSVSGLDVLPGTAETGTGRVEWQLDPATGTLSRRFWRSLSPAGQRAAGPEVAILDGVAEMTLRLLTEDGWARIGSSDGDALPARAPDAVELTLRTDRHGVLRVMVAP